jgi:hypothetical protein
MALGSRTMRILLSDLRGSKVCSDSVKSHEECETRMRISLYGV